MILLTGATGLLGSHLLYELLTSGEKVRATHRPSSNLDEVRKVFSFYTPDPDDLFGKIEWVEIELEDPDIPASLLSDIDRVYHAAAAVSFDPRDRKKLINGNREITANLVNACLEKKNIRFLHVSSTSALGVAPDGELVTEKVMWTPDKKNSGYSISKFLSEMEVWRGMEEGLEALIVNPSIILGPGFWHKGSSSMFTNTYGGLKYYTKGVTGYVGVNDVVKTMIALMNSKVKNERFIINSENHSYRDIFYMMANALDVKPPSIEASPAMAGIAWRFDAFRSLFGSKRVITRETVRAAFHKTSFSNEKVRLQTNLSYQPIKQVVEQTARVFKGQMS